MTKEQLPQEYQNWIKLEQTETAAAYNRYKEQSSQLSFISKKKAIRIRTRIRTSIAAAILILALGTTLWIKRDAFFKPKYSEEQIALSYEHALKTLAIYSKTLNKGFDKFQSISTQKESTNKQIKQ